MELVPNLQLHLVYQCQIPRFLFIAILQANFTLRVQTRSDGLPEVRRNRYLFTYDVYEVVLLDRRRVAIENRLGLIGTHFGRA